LSKRIFSRKLFIFIVFILIFACDYKPSSFGSFQKIVVFADSSLFKAVQTELEQTFDQYIYTPHTERSFYLDLQPLNAFETYKTRRNLLFIGLLDGGDEVSSFITESLSPQVKESVRNNQIFEIFKPDLFSTDQVVIFLTAKDIPTLSSNLNAQGEYIFKQLNKLYFERLEKAMFLKGEQLILEDYLAEEFGWKMRIQHDYELVKKEESGDFAWFRRLNPDRSLFLHRFQSDGFDQDGEWLYTLRDSITSVFYEGDSIDRKDTMLQIVDFAERSALKLTGVWQNSKHLIGGPFRTYAFYDEASKYIYVIDISVTAPGQLKKQFLDQLEVMANSITLLNH
jgi:hypothetical protein